MNSKEKFTALENRFRQDCQAINLQYEYGKEFNGYEKYAIITNLTEKELLEKYETILQKYKPFLLLPKQFGEIRRSYINNENKHWTRAYRNGDGFNYDDEITIALHPELVGESFEDAILDKMQVMQIKQYIRTLPKNQRERISAFLFEEKTAREIARDEGVHHSAINKTIKIVLEKIKKNCV